MGLQLPPLIQAPIPHSTLPSLCMISIASAKRFIILLCDLQAMFTRPSFAATVNRKVAGLPAALQGEARSIGL